MRRILIGLTDHVEGPVERSSSTIFDELAELVTLADDLGVAYFWFAEHHAHAHQGHLPTPLLFALHMAGRTRKIQLGTGIICLNLHHSRDVAEQVAVADILSRGRIAAGFGSGSTPEEASLFGCEWVEESVRHARFSEALEALRLFWSGESLPRPNDDLYARCWQAVNSVGSAEIAGLFGLNILFSHLRTPEQNRDYVRAYRAQGGKGLVALNRPIFVGDDDDSAFEEVEPTLRLLWRRFQREGKIPAGTPEPESPADLTGHPINFIVGGPDTVAARLREISQVVDFDVINAELHWQGLSQAQVIGSLSRLMTEVEPRLNQRLTSTVGTTR